MNIFSALLVLFLIWLGVTIALPILTFGAWLIVTLGCLFLWFLPILIIAKSDKVCGGEKLAWILAIIFLSWFACIFYFLLAPLKEKPAVREYRYY